MSRRRINIAIDGHSSSGKSTVAKALARTLNFVYVDTGAMYRAATLFAMRERLIQRDQLDALGLEKALERMYLQFKFNPASNQSEVHLNGTNVEREIRSMEVAKWVSQVAAVPAVRKKLVGLQQRMADMGGVVMDGRDIGTVVLPEAELKFFITADPRVRAGRRHKELVEKGKEVPFEEVLENVLERDRIDSTREVGPLRQAPDAVLVDNSMLTLDEQFDFIASRARRALEEHA
jgi:cytidylate kinase